MFETLTVNELGLQLAGMPKLDVEKLKENCICEGYSKDDQAVRLFFEIVKEYDETM